MATSNSNAGGSSRYYRSTFFSDAFLDNATQMGAHPNTVVSNVARSGQLGIGIRASKLDGATPIVFHPTQVVLLQAPSMWDQYPQKQECLRALIETHAKSISGIDVSYTLNTTQTPVGHDGQQLEIPTNTTRAAVSPSFTFIEYTGCPIFNLFKDWICEINHPDTNYSSLPAQVLNTGSLPMWSVSSYSMSIALIQYDPSGLPERVQDGAIILNMFPKETSTYGFERNIGQSKTMERTIPFSGIIQHNEQTKQLAMNIAKMLQMHRANANFSLPGLGATTAVDGAIDPKIRSYGGLEYELGSTSKTGVPGALQQYVYQGTGLPDTPSPGGGDTLVGSYVAKTETQASNFRIAATGANTPS